MAFEPSEPRWLAVFAAINNRREVAAAGGVIKSPLSGPGDVFIGMSTSITPEAPVQKDHWTDARSPVQYKNSVLGMLSKMSTVYAVMLN